MNRYQHHIDKAASMGGARLISEVHTFANYVEYFVRGSKGDVYSVFYDDAKGYRCGCPAGERGCCCYHCGAVYLRRLADSIVLAPVTVPAPARCYCGSGLDDHGRCLDNRLFGSHLSAAA